MMPGAAKQPDPGGSGQGARQGCKSSAGSGRLPHLRTGVEELKRRGISQKNNVSSAFPSH